MIQIEREVNNTALTNLRSSLQNIFSAYTSKYADVIETLSRQIVPFGGNLLEDGHRSVVSERELFDQQTDWDQEYSENRYSVLYMLNEQYQHVGCSSQAEAQFVQGMMMTDGYRIPVGIYDSETDTFEWELIGQYFHSQDPASEQHRRLQEVLTVARVLRRRDSSWQPGYLQRPGLFA